MGDKYEDSRVTVTHIAEEVGQIRRVITAVDFGERALAPGRAFQRQSRPDATDRERFAPARSMWRGAL